MWTRAEAVELSPQQRQELMRLAQGRNVAQKIALRARIILGASDGKANHRLAKELGVSRPTILLWRERFQQAGVEGLLHDASRPGRRKKLKAEKIANIVEATLKTKPRDATHWSVRTMAKAQRVSPSMVQRIWQAHGLKPHRVESFKFSTDPIYRRCSGSSSSASSSGRYWGPPWIWIRPCLSAMAARKAASRATIRANMAVPHTIRCWQFWLRPSWSCMPGCAAAIAARRAASPRS